MPIPRGRPGGIVNPRMARAAAVTAEISRTQASPSPQDALTRTDKKVGKKGDPFMEAPFDEPPFDGSKQDATKLSDVQDAENVEDAMKKLDGTKRGWATPSTTQRQSAGSGGDFKPLKGKKDPWDANSDKGNKAAKNDAGIPDTPSGA